MLNTYEVASFRLRTYTYTHPLDYDGVGELTILVEYLSVLVLFRRAGSK